MSLIQERPVCFECDRQIDSLADAIFAPPFDDDMGKASVVFHGLCLMVWRDKRDAIRREMHSRFMAFLQHINGEGECTCPPKDES